MKINIKSIEKAKKNAIDNEVWQITNEIIQDENALVILAAISKFGLGPKRINDLLDAIDDYKDNFAEYAKEGMLRDKIIEYLKSYKVDVSRIYSDIDRYEVADNKLKKLNQDKPISIAEASEMQSKLKVMKGLM